MYRVFFSLAEYASFDLHGYWTSTRSPNTSRRHLLTAATGGRTTNSNVLRISAQIVLLVIVVG